MRMGTSDCAPEKEETGADTHDRGKVLHNASSKVNFVVHKMLFPMLDNPSRSHVSLDSEADQVELDLLDQVGRQKPSLLEDQQSFIAHLQSLLERYRRRCSGPTYTRVPPAP